MEWISIKDESPQEGQAVLLCIEIDYSVGFIYTSGAFVGGRWKINESHNLLDVDCYEYEDSYADDITHWMPLPPPPSSHNSDFAKLVLEQAKTSLDHPVADVRELAKMIYTLLKP